MQQSNWSECYNCGTTAYIYCIAENFHQEKIFANFTTCLHGQNFYPANFLSHIDDYTEDMATFTALAKIYSSEYFCNARVAGIDEIFVQRKFSAIQYIEFNLGDTTCRNVPVFS